jgi:hypothetical protein
VVIVLTRVDHLVYAARDLDLAVERIEALLGVRAAPGGRHPGRGTRNALLALGPTSYLELIGPDAEQVAVERPRWFGIDDLVEPRLITWAVSAADLESVVTQAAQRGVKLGEVLSGSRMRADGVALRWRYTSPLPLVSDGLVPFFIDWGDTPHPARSAPAGAVLIALRVEHPDARRIENELSGLGLDLSVELASRPALVATLDCARGRVELR